MMASLESASAHPPRSPVRSVATGSRPLGLKPSRSNSAYSKRRPACEGSRQANQAAGSTRAPFRTRAHRLQERLDIIRRYPTSFSESEDRSMNRWRVVVGGVSMNLALGSLYAWSVFVLPLEKEFG